MREGGLRIGEVLGLWLQDIEFHRNGVWIRRRRALDNQALAKTLREGEQRFVDLSPGLMALLDQLVLKHNYDTDHLFVVLKTTARDKRGRVSEAQGRRREAGSEGSVEQKREPMNKNRIGGIRRRVSWQPTTKPISIKGAGCKSGGCALKAVELTSGELLLVAESRLRW